MVVKISSKSFDSIFLLIKHCNAVDRSLRKWMYMRGANKIFHIDVDGHATDAPVGDSVKSFGKQAVICKVTRITRMFPILKCTDVLYSPTYQHCNLKRSQPRRRYTTKIHLTRSTEARLSSGENQAFECCPMRQQYENQILILNTK